MQSPLALKTAPSPSTRSESSLVDSVSWSDDDKISISFVGSNPSPQAYSRTAPRSCLQDFHFFLKDFVPNFGRPLEGREIFRLREGSGMISLELKDSASRTRGI